MDPAQAKRRGGVQVANIAQIIHPNYLFHIIHSFYFSKTDQAGGQSFDEDREEREGWKEKLNKILEYLFFKHCHFQTKRYIVFYQPSHHWNGGTLPWSLVILTALLPSHTVLS